MLKNYKIMLILGSFLFCCNFTACSIEVAGLASGQAEQEEVIPEGFYPTIRSQTIKVGEGMSLQLPESYHYAQRKVDAVDTAGNHVGTYTAWYGFEKDVAYVRPDDEDVMFYVFKGTDLVTPDEELTAPQAERSLRSYVLNFVGEKEKRSSPVMAAGGTLIDINQDGFLGEGYWVYPFYVYDNRDGITSTYGTMLYPKYYYGVCILDRWASSLPSREWYMFIFSNDAAGGMVDEGNYERIFAGIKERFGITRFPTQYTEEDVQKRLEAGIEVTDPLLVAPVGYDYEQLLLLFSGTMDYYRVKPNIGLGREVGDPEAGDPGTGGESAEGESRRYEGLYAVLEVVDGDTVDVDLDGERTRIRLIGMDTPESVNPDESLNVPEGKEAARILEELIEQHGGCVYLEMGEGEGTDPYGRKLAYVYVTDGRTVFMVNQALVQQGWARVMTVEPDTRYSGEFERLEGEAKKAGAGFWGTGFFK